MRFAGWKFIEDIRTQHPNASLRRIAEASNITHYSTLSRISSGRVLPTMATFIQLCDHFKLKPSDYFYKE